MGLFKRKRSKGEDASPEMTVQTRDIEIDDTVYKELLRSVEKSDAKDLETQANNQKTEKKITAGSKRPPSADIASSGLAGLGLGSDYVDRFRAPEFKAHLSPKTKDHDVTVKDTPRSQAIEDFDATITHPSPHAGTGRGRADVSAMRLDVARISADISSGEELYRRAQSRIENLTQFVERAEVDFSMLNRLEPENRRLKARNKTLTAEVNDKDRKISVLEADLEDHRQRLAERTQISEQAQARLAQATKSLQEYEKVLKKTQTESDHNRLSLERNQTALEVERRETEILRDKVAELSEALDARSIETTEAKKMAESLREDCGDFRNQANRFEAENNELRNALDAALKQNNAMKGEMMSLHEDIRNFKTQYEFNVIAREDQITALESQIAELNRQVEIKDEIVRNAARDVSELRKLRTAQDLERDRLEKLIDAQSYQLEDAQNALVQARQDASEFDRRYRDVAAALSITQQRQAHDLHSADIAELPDTRFDGVSDADVEQHITDMAFGVTDKRA